MRNDPMNQVLTASLFVMTLADPAAAGEEVDRWRTLQRQLDAYRKLGKLSDRDYPLTWEATASQARYEGMNRLAPVYAEQRICAPHTWHAAEAFL